MRVAAAVLALALCFGGIAALVLEVIKDKADRKLEKELQELKRSWRRRSK